MSARQIWKVAGLFLSLSLTVLAAGNAARPGEIVPENQALPCSDYLFGCDSWCAKQDCGCTPGPGEVLCGTPTCRCDLSGDSRTCYFCQT